MLLQGHTLLSPGHSPAPFPWRTALQGSASVRLHPRVRKTRLGPPFCPPCLPATWLPVAVRETRPTGRPHQVVSLCTATALVPLCRPHGRLAHLSCPSRSAGVLSALDALSPQRELLTSSSCSRCRGHLEHTQPRSAAAAAHLGGVSALVLIGRGRRDV